MLSPWPLHTPPFVSRTDTWTPVWSLWLSGLVTEVNPPKPVLFAHLPASPILAQLALISDSSTASWGATIAGGGALQVLGFWNGSVWTVMAS